ncbi:hypothetical protein NDU88_001044 [Pleurodeles waltl]|uniref:Uncharacterized protein n=1 Tax=Pleurodeles waltl TaxID=8319 RepID=A0AAV7VYY7_PLEWA|nr:hypothetical protein NDU88_001044 [Pleurodeles waltl]
MSPRLRVFRLDHDVAQLSSLPGSAPELAWFRARGVLTPPAAPVSADSARNLQSSNGGQNLSAPGEANRTQQGSRPTRESEVQLNGFGPPASPPTTRGRDTAAEAWTGRGAAHTRHPARRGSPQRPCREARAPSGAGQQVCDGDRGAQAGDAREPHDPRARR